MLFLCWVFEGTVLCDDVMYERNPSFWGRTKDISRLCVMFCSLSALEASSNRYRLIRKALLLPVLVFSSSSCSSWLIFAKFCQFSKFTERSLKPICARMADDWWLSHRRFFRESGIRSFDSMDVGLLIGLMHDLSRTKVSYFHSAACGVDQLFVQFQVQIVWKCQRLPGAVPWHDISVRNRT